MMNIWDESHIRSKYIQFDPIAYTGIKAWNHYNCNYKFYFIQYNELLENEIIIYPVIKHKMVSKHLQWYNHISYEEYAYHCDFAYKILNQFNLTLLKYKDHVILNRYFQYLNDLIFDIHLNGRFNVPTFAITERWDDKITMHPGQNLYWASKFLNLPKLAWLSVPNNKQHILNNMSKNICLIKKIENQDDIFDVYSTYLNFKVCKINAFIQNASFCERPFLAPLLPVYGRTVFGPIGNSDSPWDRIKKWDRIISLENIPFDLNDSKIVYNPNYNIKYADYIANQYGDLNNG